MSYFIITIDTEGDNLWVPYQRSTGYRNITTYNATYIPRFQSLCEKYGLIPTYLTNYEMASDEFFVSNAKEWQRDKKCEVGTHLHAWNNPPMFDLKYHRYSNNPYAGEYPREILSSKLRYLTELIETSFGCRPTSHRGGRWYIDSNYLVELEKLDYIVDCTVTPGLSWENNIGNTMQGTDYTKYFFKGQYPKKSGVLKRGDSKIIEIPPTIIPENFGEKVKKQGICKALTSTKGYYWLRPNGSNLKEMLSILENRMDYYEFMIHSSELMPNGSPYFKSEKDISKLYDDIECLFDIVKAKQIIGTGLSDYARKYVSS